MNDDPRQLVRVQVTTGIRHEYFEVGKRGVFQAGVKEKPVENRANERVRELAAIHFRVPISSVRIVSGHRHRNKRLHVTQ